MGGAAGGLREDAACGGPGAVPLSRAQKTSAARRGCTRRLSPEPREPRPRPRVRARSPHKRPRMSGSQRVASAQDSAEVPGAQPTAIAPSPPPFGSPGAISPPLLFLGGGRGVLFHHYSAAVCAAGPGPRVTPWTDRRVPAFVLLWSFFFSSLGLSWGIRSLLKVCTRSAQRDRREGVGTQLRRPKSSLNPRAATTPPL